MNDSTLFPVIMVLMGAYSLTCLAQYAHWLYTKWLDRHHEVMECSNCKEISLEFMGYIYPRDGSVDGEWECKECGNYEVHFERKVK